MIVTGECIIFIHSFYKERNNSSTTKVVYANSDADFDKASVFVFQNCVDADVDAFSVRLP